MLRVRSCSLFTVSSSVFRKAFFSEQIPKSTVIVREIAANEKTPAMSHFSNEVIVRDGKHKFPADEPMNFPGGADTGPNPYELLMASLGACTSMTVRVYANRKGIPLERVIVSLSHSKIYAEDCLECEKKTGKVDRIICNVELIGKDLTEGMRQTLFDIANKCPVHQTLTSKPLIKVNLL